MDDKNCLNCIYKEVCLRRNTTIFMLYIQAGRYSEVEEAKKCLDVSGGCENWSGQCENLDCEFNWHQEDDNSK